MDFKEELKIRANYAEEIIKKYMPEEVGYQKTIMEAMNYSLSSGGKRLRPVLTLEACRIVGGDTDNAIPFAAAIEMIHTYSLIHDDLPALDNDDLRRGRATNHKVFGEAMAILAGDALLNFAYETMLKESIGKENPERYLRATYEIAKGSIGKENPERYLRATYEIAKGAGIYGMVGGQVVDVQSENMQIPKEKLDYIHENKTAAMMVGCMRAGAAIGGADEKQMELITDYANKIGLAFQIVDDILDIVGDEAKLGKHVGSDIENNKSTYPSLMGLEKSREIATELIEDAKRSISKVTDDTGFLDGLADYINNKSTYPSLMGLEKSREIATELIEDAKRSISKVTDDTGFLDGLADYIFNKSTYPSLMGLEKSREIATELIEDAKRSISKVTDDTGFLDGLADYILSRDH